MEAWDLCLTSNHQSLDFDWPCPYLDYLNPLLCDNAIDMIPESALINHPYSICNELCFDKDLSNWTDEFLSDGKVDEMPIKAENVTANSPVAGSSHSGLEEQHSEICVEYHQVERSNEKDNKKTSEIVKSKKRKKCTEKGPKYAFMTRSMEDIVEDGYKWRKYGTKIIKSKPYPRSYYKCSASNCGVKKTVERDPNDPTMLITTYEGNHNHESPSVIYYIGKPIVFQQPGSMPPLCFSMLDSTLRF